MQSEAEVVKECIEWLHEHGWICRRKQVGGFFRANGARIRVGKLGEADYEAIKPLKNGNCLVVEVEFKSTIGKQSKIQMEYEAMVKQKGLQYICVNSLEDLQMEIQALEEMVNESKARN